MGVAYTWKIYGYQIKASQTQTGQSLTITETGECVPFNGIPSMMFDLFGGYRKIGNRLVRIWPQRHWMFPWCRATDFESSEFQAIQYIRSQVTGKAGLLTPWEPRNPTTNALASGKGKCTITYTMPTLDEEAMDKNDGGDSDQEIDVATETWNFGGKDLTLRNQFFKLLYTGTIISPDDYQVTKTFPTIQIQLVRHRCLAPPSQTICRLLGKINKSAFRMNSATFPAGTIRFEGATSTRKLTTGQGFKFFEISYRFAVNPVYDYIVRSFGGGLGLIKDFVGWNRIFVPSRGAWEDVIYQIPADAVVGLTGSVRGIHLYDEDFVTTVTAPNGKTMKGMQALFWAGSQ